MSINFPPCPNTLKSIQQYLKIASEHDTRDVVVSYWCRLYGLQIGMKLTANKSQEETALLLALMDWLETCKKQNADNEAVTNEVAAQAHLENYALKLFLYADKQDRAANFGKNVVKAFYTAGVIFDVLSVFGELTEEVLQNRKYAKWKAAYIHTCLKNGETPVPGPVSSDSDGIDQESAEPGPSTLPIAGSTTPPVSNTTPQEENIGGFKAFEEPVQQQDTNNRETASLTPDQITKAQKYCKWASSALSYDDIKTAVVNLQKALTLLQTGSDCD